MLKRLTLALLALITFCACQAETPGGTSMTTVTVINPFTNCTSLEEAEELSGIQLTLPEDLAACEKITYRAAHSETLTLLEVICTMGEDEIHIRKAPGFSDISGDYRNFSTSTSSCGETISFTTHGDGEKEYLATWSSDDYSYSISSEEGVTAAILQEWVYATK